MRSTTIAALLLTFAVGCEHKSKTAPTGTPEPVGKDPTPSAEVRAPVAADLAGYTKDLPGSGDKLMARIETPLGTLNCELYGDKAPITVANFVGLATGKKAWLNPKTSKVEKGKPYFDGLIFHRVIPGFMLQGGDPLGVGRGGPGYQFEDELATGFKMGPGALAMANAGPVTNGSQFFVMQGSRPDLEEKHTIFGQCKEIEVINKIAATPTGANDLPNEPVTMKITISKG